MHAACECGVQEVDWAAHPAECILAITTQGKYVVKRRGMPLQEFGLVDAATARRKAGEGNGGAAGAVVPAALINEFEGSRKRFEKETTAHTLSRELDLGAAAALYVDLNSLNDSFERLRSP